MRLLRAAMKATDKFIQIAHAEYDEERGIPYRDALKGVIVTQGRTRRERRWIMRAYDRLKSYRRYVRLLEYRAKYGDEPQWGLPFVTTSAVNAFARRAVIDSIYQSRGLLSALNPPRPANFGTSFEANKPND